MAATQEIGTNHFVSKEAADRYYRDYGYENADGQLADGSIVIGKPALQPGDRLLENPGEGRYTILRLVEPAKPAVKQLSLMDEAGLLSVVDNRVVLPAQHLVHYAELKRLLETSGGQYSSKGFAFPDGIDAAEVIECVRVGKALNGKKTSQSFFTPEDEAYAVVREVGPLLKRRVLEPSAGDGALADIARAAGAEVVVVESYRPNALVLTQKGYDVIERDFLSLSPEDIGYFDAICANPPFSGDQDIEHVTHMLDFLKPGGILSVITSIRWVSGALQRHREFRSLMDAYGATWVEIGAGAFKTSGTMVSTVRIRLQKPDVPAEDRVTDTPAMVIAKPTGSPQLALAF